MFDKLLGCDTIMCSFDKTATVGTIAYQLFLIFFIITALLVLSKYRKNIFLHWGIMAIGAFIYEFFTAPMKFNLHLGSFGYIYHSVAWILSLGFTTLIFTTVTLVDKFLPKWKEIPRTLLSIGILMPILVFVEKFVVSPLGIREYTPETIASFKGAIIPFTNGASALEILYIPVFLVLIISFYKYFSFVLDKKALLPMNKQKHIRNFLISLTGVVLFELTVGSMVNNLNFPSWSYYFHDLTIILTGVWVIMVWAIMTLVDKYFINKSVIERFLTYILLIAIVITPYEAWLIHNGFRQYGPSAVANFSGYVVPFFNVPVEIVFAIPFYFALVIGFIKYITLSLDNRI